MLPYNKLTTEFAVFGSILPNYPMILYTIKHCK